MEELKGSVDTLVGKLSETSQELAAKQAEAKVAKAQALEKEAARAAAVAEAAEIAKQA